MYIPRIFHRCSECAIIPGVSNPSTKRPVARLNTSITTKSPAMTLIRSKFFIRIISRILPAKHILDFCANAPNTRPPIKDAIIGACMLPGPAWLAFRSVVHVARIKIATTIAGRTAPLTLLVTCALPRLNPFFNANTPVATPRMKPTKATHAFRSPADIRITIRRGHPRNTSAPIIMITPRIKRIIGDDPAVERYSFVAIEMINAPSTRPIISGLAYCTTSA
ncbi:Uncharacterised protein [Dorea longicatena]|nr:Uncharacterised protein [Dorea longicatena]